MVHPQSVSRSVDVEERKSSGAIDPERGSLSRPQVKESLIFPVCLFACGASTRWPAWCRLPTVAGLWYKVEIAFEHTFDHWRDLIGE